MMTDLDLEKKYIKSPLSSGSHKTRDQGMCAMEMVAYLAGEQHSDRPECTCPVLALYTIDINDTMGLWREKLKPFLPYMIGTNTGLDDESKRAKYIIRRVATEILPIALDAGGLTDHAQKLRDAQTLRCMEEVCYSASNKAAKAASIRAESTEHKAHFMPRINRFAFNAGDAIRAARALVVGARASYAAQRAAEAVFMTVLATNVQGPIWSLAIDILDGAIQIGSEDLPAPDEQVCQFFAKATV